MGALILVSGPNGSGKSRFAEGLIGKIPGRERFYIATMAPVTEDNRKRIAAHRRQRAGLGFVTLELPGPVGGAAVSDGAAVLLEDVSNLLANALFGGAERGEKAADADAPDRGEDVAEADIAALAETAAETAAETVLRDILCLRDRCGALLAVTVSGLDPGGYTGETAAYIRALNRLNGALYTAADAAAALRAGVPLWEKGGPELIQI